MRLTDEELAHLRPAESEPVRPDPMSQPLSAIVDGWVLHDGSLYLMVRCADNVIRSTTLPRPKATRGWGQP